MLWLGPNDSSSVHSFVIDHCGILSISEYSYIEGPAPGLWACYNAMSQPEPIACQYQHSTELGPRSILLSIASCQDQLVAQDYCSFLQLILAGKEVQ